MSRDGEPPLHPDLEPVAWLLGSWRGEGAGSFPTIQSFRYGEELRFWHVGKPFLAFAQRTCVELATATIASARTAKEVTHVERTYQRRPEDTLAYTVAMAAVGQPLTHHLAAELHRTAPSG